jgi:hypothetical protein
MEITDSKGIHLPTLILKIISGSCTALLVPRVVLGARLSHRSTGSNPSK